MGGDGAIRAEVLAHLKRDAIVEIEGHAMCLILNLIRKEVDEKEVFTVVHKMKGIFTTSCITSL
jgi:hypothetical protein